MMATIHAIRVSDDDCSILGHPGLLGRRAVEYLSIIRASGSGLLELTADLLQGQDSLGKTTKRRHCRSFRKLIPDVACQRSE